MSASHNDQHKTDIELQDRRGIGSDDSKRTRAISDINHEMKKLNGKDEYGADGKYNSRDSLDTPLNSGPRPAFYFMDTESLKQLKLIVDSQDKTANPAALGLLGFGLTTFLLNMHNAGVYPLNTMILAMGLFYGGLAQLIAGIFEWKKGQMFGMIAFMSYGLFWISLCTLLILPDLGIGKATNPTAMAWYLFIWGCFSTCMFVGTLKSKPWALVFVFFTVVLLFFLLASYNWTLKPDVLKAAGIEGVICGLSAIYTAFGEILNETYGRTIIPLGIRTPPKK
ncbi:UNKNOWN [Stylonychia lemnae]|uniref:Uncharacterized protein n=1 Tax=Stylonychia lemnae TaxID=5949 RepID=A0A078AN14_STYLE|nr:UNKNOWN [Stylonychia lemnae]|eukprot:CDW82288.1 UNKNOWN [Stylonychia lemnae]